MLSEATRGLGVKMQTLNEILQQTQSRQVALGHFNVADPYVQQAVSSRLRLFTNQVLNGTRVEVLA
jgi:hypothetical protein